MTYPNVLVQLAVLLRDDPDVDASDATCHTTQQLLRLRHHHTPHSLITPSALGTQSACPIQSSTLSHTLGDQTHAVTPSSRRCSANIRRAAPLVASVLSMSTTTAEPTAHSLKSLIKLSLHPHTASERVDVPPFRTTYALSPRLRIVAFGDSLTQQAAFPDGWYTLLSARYQRRADLFERGYSGYTSRNALTTLTHHMQAGIWPYSPSASPELASSTATATATAADTSGSESSTTLPSPVYTQLVTLCLGANDSAMPSVDGDVSLHVPLDTFTANVRRIIELLVPEYAQLTAPPSRYLSSTTALILITPPQLDEPTWRNYLAKRDGTPPVRARDNGLVGQYAAAVKAIAADWHIPVVDMYTLTPPTAAGTWPYFVDGLHYNAEGNAAVFLALVDCVERNYPSLSVERLGLDAPPFDQGWLYDDDATGEQKWPHNPSTGK